MSGKSLKHNEVADLLEVWLKSQRISDCMLTAQSGLKQGLKHLTRDSKRSAHSVFGTPAWTLCELEAAASPSSWKITACPRSLSFRARFLKCVAVPQDLTDRGLSAEGEGSCRTRGLEEATHTQDEHCSRSRQDTIQAFALWMLAHFTEKPDDRVFVASHGGLKVNDFPRLACLPRVPLFWDTIGCRASPIVGGGST